MNDSLIQNLTLDELLRVMPASEDPYVAALVRQVEDHNPKELEDVHRAEVEALEEVINDLRRDVMRLKDERDEARREAKALRAAAGPILERAEALALRAMGLAAQTEAMVDLLKARGFAQGT